jgi:hypothetical protein
VGRRCSMGPASTQAQAGVMCNLRWPPSLSTVSTRQSRPVPPHAHKGPRARLHPPRESSQPRQHMVTVCRTKSLYESTIRRRAFHVAADEMRATPPWCSTATWRRIFARQWRARSRTLPGSNKRCGRHSWGSRALGHNSWPAHRRMSGQQSSRGAASAWQESSRGGVPLQRAG